ncbi:hypothetical protein GCM10007301_00650 [Azorhizobium oxalatiphilum]|uniref:Uncharacterized protein n=1 Tax=Azorhizobium oxalatiphilum TaxID=980631 RepID=A0A917BK67_9HYPH|nr:hypothetical protein [Azorhizobium oxalatiphilum]GGF45022.1 hypothetical protein GCM10007301_00650 [Azorhizobium oxalatiphilum]
MFLRHLSAFAAGALGLLALGSGALADTYCQSDETAVFSCDFGSHTGSVCASQDIGPGKGRLTYRFGHLDRVLMAYPPAGTVPAKAFTSGAFMVSGGGGAWLRFEDQKIRYTVFTAIGKWNPRGGPLELAGVVMEQNGREPVSMACRGEVINELGPAFFEQAGLKAAGEFEIPKTFLPR